MQEHWIADRMRRIEVSGIRRVFDLAKTLKDPVNLSIGQPHFDVPEPIKAAAKAAIDRGANGYTPSQGIAELRDRLQADIRNSFKHTERSVMITSGTGGGLMLALMCCVNPGDEVIVFDPYFVMYPHQITLCGGRMVVVDTHPTFQIDLDQVRAAFTERTKAIIVNSPSNPSGVVLSSETLRGLAKLADDRGVVLISDEIYHAFCYDGPFCTPASFSENVVVVDGFGKTYGMTGWRMGFAHGPKTIIDEMIKLQQFTFVCAPSIAQHGTVAALDMDVRPIVDDYRRKRDRLCAGLCERFEFARPGGAFYLYPKAPGGSGTKFVERAIARNLLIIPGSTFSGHDTHFRVSYAADDAVLDRGIEILNGLAGL
jgi:aspartate aminotransferase/aminotransferase